MLIYHDPVALQLVLDMKYTGLHNETHTPHNSWIKANESDIYNYRCMLSDTMCRIKLPSDALLCSYLQYSDPAHFNAVNLYAKNVTDACNDAATTSIPLTCNGQASRRMPGLLYNRYATNRYSGTACGLTAIVRKRGRWLIQCGELELLITTPFEI